MTASSKRLSCRFLYDDEGARLFNAICDLPEYYPTRAEDQILDRRDSEIVERFLTGTGARGEESVELVELGGGDGRKTRRVIEALLARRGALHFDSIDISREALEIASDALLDSYPALTFTGIVGEYGDGLDYLSGTEGPPRLFLWLGSSIGNFERDQAAQLLRSIRRVMSPQDGFLLGIDLRKDRETLEAAYDDSQGVTAAFNKNLLRRINRELRGGFDREAFRHRAVWNELDGRVELFLESEREQVVRIDALDLDVAFREGERIHTEDSTKYSDAEIDKLLGAVDLEVDGRWYDEERRFTVVLARPGVED